VNLINLAVAFGAGLISITSPCCLPLLPGYLGYLSGLSAREVEANRGRTVAAALLFVAGFSVVFIALAEGISSCEMLAGAIRQGPLAQDLTFPYHPHVTVAHDIEDAALDVALERLADYGCAFDVTAFHLYIHGEDGVWRPERSFTLAS